VHFDSLGRGLEMEIAGFRCVSFGEQSGDGTKGVGLGIWNDGDRPHEWNAGSLTGVR